MPDNAKKEYPVNGLEQICTSKKMKREYKFVSNRAGISKWVKRKLNKRFRKKNNQIAYEEKRTL